MAYQLQISVESKKKFTIQCDHSINTQSSTIHWAEQYTYTTAYQITLLRLNDPEHRKKEDQQQIRKGQLTTQRDNHK